MHNQLPIPFKQIPEETHRWGFFFCSGKPSSYCQRGIS